MKSFNFVFLCAFSSVMYFDCGKALSQSPLNYNLVGVTWSETDGLFLTIDPATGNTISTKHTSFPFMNSLAKSSDGTLFTVGGSQSLTTGSNRLVTINPNTGKVTDVVRIDLGPNNPVSIRGLAFSPTGVLYAINTELLQDSVSWLYTINLQTGAGTFVGSSGFEAIQSIEFAPDGTLYGWALGYLSSTIVNPPKGLIEIDPMTAIVTDVDPLVNPTDNFTNSIQSLAFAPDGHLYAIGKSLYQVDVTSGARTLVASGLLDFRGLEAVPVPEPLTITLLALGAIGLLIFRRL